MDGSRVASKTDAPILLIAVPPFPVTVSGAETGASFDWNWAMQLAVKTNRRGF
jgi:hypothetical protein